MRNGFLYLSFCGYFNPSISGDFHPTLTSLSTKQSSKSPITQHLQMVYIIYLLKGNKGTKKSTCFIERNRYNKRVDR